MLRSLTLLLLLAPALACGGGGGETTGDGGTSGTDPATTGAATSTGAPTDPAPTGDVPTGTGTTGEPEITTSSSSGAEDTAGTTGEPAFCHGWEASADAPFLELYDRGGAPLDDGATLPLECGPQGLLMFGIYPTFGGFDPPGDILDFALVVDVDGFNENPEGHFYSANPVGYYVSCEDTIGGVFGVLPVFPFDNLADLAALDGKPAAVRVVMHAPGGDVVVERDLVLAATEDRSWEFCGG